MTNTNIKTIDFCIKFGIDFFKKSGLFDDFYDAHLECKIVMAWILNLPVKDLILVKDNVLDNNDFSRFNKCLSERITGKPIYKIIGVRPFFQNEFITDIGVLDPRFDTEVLVESVLESLSKNAANSGVNILELGVGSGCVLLSILAEVKNACGFGVDISSNAIDVAVKNSARIGVQNRVKFLHKDWNEIKQSDFYTAGDFAVDCVVSNPPYILTDDIKNLSVEVRNFDPIVALDGGHDGLKCYRDIAKLLSNSSQIFLKKNAKVFLEIGIGQGDDVRKIFSDCGFAFVKSDNDLSGVERVLIFENI